MNLSGFIRGNWVALGIILMVATGYGIPEMINYQGKIEVDGAPFTGTGYFRFAILDETSAYVWSNDGFFPPIAGETVTVNNGLYHVILGDPSIMEAIPSSLFDDTDELYLRIWFNDGVNGLQQLSPDQRLTSVGYSHKADLARDADTVDGTHAADLEESAEIDADIAAHTAISSAHHTKTTSFSELTDAATDAQIPDTITINYAAAAGDAGTLDSIDSSQFLRSDQNDTMNGNLTVTGTMQSAGFRMTTSPTNGYVLTSDASGNGSWQPVSGGAGGVGFEYPDGLSNIYPMGLYNLLTTPYQVPPGVNFYITNVYAGNTYSLFINGATVLIGVWNMGGVSGSFNHLAQPLIARETDWITSNNNSLLINGFLITAGTIPITRNLLNSTPYTVPSGQTLVILNVYSDGAYLHLNGQPILTGYYNTGQVSNQIQHLAQPILVPGNVTISAGSNNVTFNGYLR
ncbi:hypothetical protein JXA40_05970 [bacterium]|nr:hypothetical protein [candidate division CSSED10-310 bacterium]